MDGPNHDPVRKGPYLPDGILSVKRERILTERMTSDRKLEAPREGSK